MLEFLFGSGLRAKIIGWLTTHSDERFFVRELTSYLNEDSTNVSRELAKLAKHNLLIRTEEGRQVYYRANKEFPIFEELRSISLKYMGVGDTIRDALSSLKDKIKTAYIFGSFARGEEIESSDIDVLILGDLKLSEISTGISSAEEKLNREINPVVYRCAEFKNRVKKGDHFLNSVMKSEKIFLIGDEDEFKKIFKE